MLEKIGEICVTLKKKSIKMKEKKKKVSLLIVI